MHTLEVEIHARDAADVNYLLMAQRRQRITSHHIGN
jgi:hypothetical protein